MQQLIMISIAGSVLVAAVIKTVLWRRRPRTHDLGSVSTAWTTEHNAADRGGDRSRS